MYEPDPESDFGIDFVPLGPVTESGGPASRYFFVPPPGRLAVEPPSNPSKSRSLPLLVEQDPSGGNDWRGLKPVAPPAGVSVKETETQSTEKTFGLPPEPESTESITSALPNRMEPDFPPETGKPPEGVVFEHFWPLASIAMVTWLLKVAPTCTCTGT